MTQKKPLSVLVLGASYGLLPATRIALAGHAVTIVCRAEEGDSIAASGVAVHLPERGGGSVFTLSPDAHVGRGSPGSIGFVTPQMAQPNDADFVFLAMQEPQLKAAEIHSLMRVIAQARVPVLSLQNMPPPPFLNRIGLEKSVYGAAYTSLSVWDGFDPDLFSLASPDAQAVRQDPTSPGALTITLATNFKAAQFGDDDAQNVLQRLAQDVDASRPGGKHPSVRLVPSEYLHAPLAKWPMLICGNCRCLRENAEPVSIAEAVHSDLTASREIYDWTASIARQMGAPDSAMVPFDRYADVAHQLTLPSSLARGLAAGAPAVERIDILLASIARHLAIDPAPLAPITRLIDLQLGGSDTLNAVA